MARNSRGGNMSVGKDKYSEYSAKYPQDEASHAVEARKVSEASRLTSRERLWYLARPQ